MPWSCIPIPKKGYLTLCDNWRGISFLYVGGKLFAKIIQGIGFRLLPRKCCLTLSVVSELVEDVLI